VFNPFADVADADSRDDELVAVAQQGNRVALEKLVPRHQAWIYNIAIRMVFHPQDAEEVTQEVPGVRATGGFRRDAVRRLPDAGILLRHPESGANAYAGQ
jgi:hypothetical protein